MRDQFVTLAGEIVSVAIESDPDPRKVDHVWITVAAGEFGPLQISLSTTSRQSRNAGFDPRVRVAIITSRWEELPPAGVRLAQPFDYAEFPAEFIAYERPALEELLMTKTRRAKFVEAWGELYIRAHVGIHQVHCRRASFAVPRDVTGRDGAIRFYFADRNASELLLLKFAGQP